MLVSVEDKFGKRCFEAADGTSIADVPGQSLLTALRVAVTLPAACGIRPRFCCVCHRRPCRSPRSAAGHSGAMARMLHRGTGAVGCRGVQSAYQPLHRI